MPNIITHLSIEELEDFNKLREYWAKESLIKKDTDYAALKKCILDSIKIFKQKLKV